MSLFGVNFLCRYFGTFPTRNKKPLDQSMTVLYGATTSKIDDQELFYLLSRGISRSIAERLIVLGFFEEVLEKIGIKEQLDQARERIVRSFNE